MIIPVYRTITRNNKIEKKFESIICPFCKCNTAAIAVTNRCTDGLYGIPLGASQKTGIIVFECCGKGQTISRTAFKSIKRFEHIEYVYFAIIYAIKEIVGDTKQGMAIVNEYVKEVERIIPDIRRYMSENENYDVFGKIVVNGHLLK